MFILLIAIAITTVQTANYQKRQASFELFEFEDFVDNVQRPMIRLMEDLSTEMTGLRLPFERNDYSNGRFRPQDGPYRPTQDVNQQHAPTGWKIGDYDYANEHKRTPVRSGYSRPTYYEESHPRGPPATNEGPVTIERKILTPGYNPWEGTANTQERSGNKENNQFRPIGKDGEGLSFTSTKTTTSPENTESIEKTTHVEKEDSTEISRTIVETTTIKEETTPNNIDEFMEEVTGDDIRNELERRVAKEKAERNRSRTTEGVNTTENTHAENGFIENNTTTNPGTTATQVDNETETTQKIETSTSEFVTNTRIDNVTDIPSGENSTEPARSTPETRKTEEGVNTQEGNDGITQEVNRTETTQKEKGTDEVLSSKNETIVTNSEKKNTSSENGLRGPPIPQQVIKKLEELGLKIDKELKQ